jgi:hypothetical protein
MVKTPQRTNPPEVTTKKSVALFTYPPKPGEFGWEVMQWQGFVRKKAKEYDRVIIRCKESSEPLYRDIPCATILNYGSPPTQVEDVDTIWVWEKDKQIPHDQQEFVVYGCEKTEHPFDILFHARNAKHREKNYPVEMWNKLSRMFYDAGYKVASVGNNAHHIEGTYDLTGESLDAIFDYMRSAKCIVGPSSGPMHLASLCNCPQVVWGDERTYVGGNTLKTRYEKTWNPLGVPVDYIITTWDSPERWKPKPKTVFLRTKRLIDNDLKSSAQAIAPQAQQHAQNLQALQAAINAALQGGKYLVEVHRKTEDLRAEYKHFQINCGMSDEDIKHCRGHFPGQIFMNTEWR